MQICHFVTGGYVVHKAMIGTTKYSAWFDPKGNIVDAERFDAAGRSYGVKEGSPAMLSLQQRYGRLQREPSTA